MEFNVLDVEQIDVIEFLKTKWFCVGFVDENEGAEVVSSLNDLFLTYSHYHQVSELMTQLFSAIKEIVAEGSGGVHFYRGYVPLSVLKIFKKCVQSLSVQQTLKLWEQFLSCCHDFFLHVNPGISLQAGALIASQFLFSFFSEINVIDLYYGNQSATRSLLKNTNQFLHLDSKIFDLKDKNNANFQVSCMLLVIAYRRLISSCNSLSSVDFTSCFTDPCCGFQFLSPHDVVGCNIDICKPYLAADDKRISYCMMNLLTQKAITILENCNYEQLTSEDKSSLKEIVSVLTDHTLSLISSGEDAFWNSDINFLCAANYNVAAVCLYVNNLPNLIKFVDAKDLATFCSAVVNIMIQNEENNSSPMLGITMNHALSNFLHLIFSAECPSFETAFVTAIWDNVRSLLCGRKRSSDEYEVGASQAYLIFTDLCNSRHKWAKYAATTPKGNEDLNSMWIMVKKISSYLNDISENPSEHLNDRLKLSETKRVLKIINYLPLRCLMPGNQVRCTFGLSLMLFLLGNSESNKNDVRIVLDEVLKALVSIFEGDRSVWLFDLVDVVPYLRAVVAVVGKLRKGPGNLGTAKPLFASLFNLTTRNVNSLMDVEKYAAELSSEMEVNFTCVEAFLCLLQRLSELLERPYLKPEYKVVCENFAAQACVYSAKYIKHRKKEDLQPDECYLLVDCYTALLKMLSHTVISRSLLEVKKKWFKWLPYFTDLALGEMQKPSVNAKSDVCLRFIQEVLLHQKEMGAFMTSDICSRLWLTLKYVLTQKTLDLEKSLCSVSSQMDANILFDSLSCHNSCSFHLEHTRDLENKDVPVEMEKCHVTFTKEENKVICSIIQVSTSEEFESIIQEIYMEMGTEVPDIEMMDVSTFQVRLCIVRSMLDADVEDSKFDLLSKLIQHCLTRLHFIMNQTCPSTRCLLSIVLPSLNFISCVLEKKHEKVSLPKQCVIQCLHSCLAVKICAYVKQPHLFIQVHQALWKVMSLLLSNYNYVVLSCRASFMPCVTMLLKASVQAGNQEFFDKCEATTRCQIQLCAHNLERLFTAMSKYEKEFAKLVPYIIADYVDLVQNVTVHPSVKSYLLAGVNRLLDICSEESLKMLAVNINHSCREIYNNLVKNYKMYRFVGQL